MSLGVVHFNNLVSNSILIYQSLRTLICTSLFVTNQSSKTLLNIFFFIEIISRLFLELFGIIKKKVLPGDNLNTMGHYIHLPTPLHEQDVTQSILRKV